MSRFTSSYDQDPERVRLTNVIRAICTGPLTLRSQARLVQAYMILHSQQTSIRRRLASSSASPTSSSNTSPLTSPYSSSPELSPARAAVYHNSPTRRSPPPVINLTHASFKSRPHHDRSPRSPFDRRSSIPTVSSIPEDPTEDDEGKLFDITGRIKMTLTDLLNCPSVRHNERMRAWVQSRLMDAQQALNESKRKRIGWEAAVQADAIGGCVGGHVRNMSL